MPNPQVVLYGML